MTRTSFKTVPVILAALLALGVGLVGTATAGHAAAEITKAQVKKIAKKVVKKSAPKLSVANAANLANKPASAYLTSTWSYTLAGHASSESRIYSFPGLPAGTYAVDYSVYMDASSSDPVGCQIRVGAEDYSAVGYGAPAPIGNRSSASGSTVVTTSGPNVVLECFVASGGFSVNTTDSVRSTVTFTKVDANTAGQAPSVPGPDTARGSRP